MDEMCFLHEFTLNISCAMQTHVYSTRRTFKDGSISTAAVLLPFELRTFVCSPFTNASTSTAFVHNFTLNFTPAKFSVILKLYLFELTREQLYCHLVETFPFFYFK